LAGAAEFAQQSIDLAQKAVDLAASSEDKKEAILTLAVNKATLAEVLHLQGKLSEARREFVEAEEIYTKARPELYQYTTLKCLHNARGFHFCDFLLDESPANVGGVEARAAAIIIIARTTDRRPYAIGLGRLLQGQALMQRHAGGERVDLDTAEAKLIDANTILRQAGIPLYLIRVQLAMGRLQFLRGDSKQALLTLDEAMEATKAGQIPLLDIDGLLEKTRILLALGKANDAQDCLDRATRQIRSTGYRRRDALVASLLRQCLE
jgi:ATP/maltotriose-dependent transcriptional regulator MalT